MFLQPAYVILLNLLTYTSHLNVARQMGSSTNCLVSSLKDLNKKFTVTFEKNFKFLKGKEFV